MTLPRRAVLAALALAAVSASPAFAQTTITIQHPLPSASHYGAGAAALKESFERATGGRYRINVQRNDNEREIIESVQIGTVECYIGSTGPVGNFVPAVRVVDVPFLFRDYAHARGLVGVIWMENGFRHLTNSRHAVNNPADVRGLKVRTMENPVHMRAFSTLGALPTPMAFSELVPALQQGTVDGQENPIPVIVANNLNQVQRYLTLTGHVYSPAALIISPAVWGKLSAADKAAFTEAAKKGAAAQRKKVNDDENSGIAQLEKEGMQVVKQVNGESFRKAVAPAYAAFAKEFGADKIAAIQAVK